MQNTMFFNKEESNSKEKGNRTTLLEKIGNIDVVSGVDIYSRKLCNNYAILIKVCREFMVELNENLSVENKRTLEPFFDDAAEKITKLKKGIDILNIEYGKFLIWLGIPASSHKV